MLTLDFVSKRYGQLPSVVMTSGSTFDFHVADVAARYELYCSEVADAKANGRSTPPARKPSLSEMLDMKRQAELAAPPV